MDSLPQSIILLILTALVDSFPEAIPDIRLVCKGWKRVMVEAAGTILRKHGGLHTDAMKHPQIKVIVSVITLVATIPYPQRYRE